LTFDISKTNILVFFLNVVWVLLFKPCKNDFGTALGLGDTWQNVMAVREMYCKAILIMDCNDRGYLCKHDTTKYPWLHG